MDDMERAVRYAANALEMVLEAARGERMLIIADKERKDIGMAFSMAALELGMYVRTEVMAAEGIRNEVPPHIIDIINTARPDIFMNLLRGGAEETPFRIKLVKMETRHRRRLAHCPGTTMDMLLHGALALSREEYLDMQSRAEALINRLNGADSIRIRNAAGTDIRIEVGGREFFTDTKINWRTMKWMNLPVGEVIVGPREFEGSGTIVCDVAIGGIGPIDSALSIKVRDGRAVEVDCDDSGLKGRVMDALGRDDMASHLGEFAFGLNPHARNVVEFVETEKLGGTVHIAFGNNIDYPGGRNNSVNHMDFLISAPDVWAYFGDKCVEIMKEGKWRV